MPASFRAGSIGPGPAALVFCLALLLPQYANAALWNDVQQGNAATATVTDAGKARFHQRLLNAEPSLIADSLLMASSAYARGSVVTGASIELPMPDGSMRRYSIEDSPVIEAGLAAKFPQFKAYKVYDIDQPGMNGRVTITPLGFHAYVDTAKGTVLIDPVSGTNAQQYRSYYKNDYVFARKGVLPPFSCGVHGRPEVDGAFNSSYISAAKNAAKTEGAIQVYRIAVATTGEYSQIVAGGNPTNTLAAVMNAIAFVDVIYERDLGIRLELVANNDQIIFTDPQTDNYTNDSPDALLIQNQAILDSIITPGGYDIGHVFNTGGGGLATLGVVCDNSVKAQGETGSSNPVGDAFYIDYVAHEIGHQFGADHSFNGTSGSCGFNNRNAATAFEPGSGVTVMSYAGICAGEDIASNSIALFHSGSIDQITAFTRTGTGASCAATGLNSGNVAPVVNAGPNYTIPGSTYFELSGSATDADLDPLSYHWDEMDVGVATSSSTIGKDLGSNALFRSYEPTSSAVRAFPRLSDVLANTVNTKAETLPTEPRVLSFRLTAEDGKGGVDKADMQVTVDGNAGPFRVLQPNTATLNLDSSQPQVVEWNAACTEQAPINCANVDILYSSDGGASFTPLLMATPNDGEESVTLIPGNTTQARIEIRCSDNIFYDISDANFSVSDGAGQALVSTGIGGSYDCGTSTGAALTAPDFEPNNTRMQASSITIPVTFSGTVNSSTDRDDYYTFTADANGTFDFNLSGYGYNDLNVYLIDSTLNIVGQSNTVTGTVERFTARLQAGETYYLLITGKDTQAVTTDYTMAITAKKSGGGGGSMNSLFLLLVMLIMLLRIGNNHTFTGLVIFSRQRRIYP